MMNDNEFIINKVYSNGELNYQAGSYAIQRSLFNLRLYEGNEDKCPCPKALNLHRRFVISNCYVWDYITPVKRTKCYLYVKHPNYVTTKHYIHKNEKGDEYIKIDNVIVYSYNVSLFTLEEAHKQYLETSDRCELSLHYIEKVEHIELYGYVYVGDKRVTSIDELRKEMNIT